MDRKNQLNCIMRADVWILTSIFQLLRAVFQPLKYLLKVLLGDLESPPISAGQLYTFSSLLHTSALIWLFHLFRQMFAFVVFFHFFEKLFETISMNSLLSSDGSTFKISFSNSISFFHFNYLIILRIINSSMMTFQCNNQAKALYQALISRHITFEHQMTNDFRKCGWIVERQKLTSFCVSIKKKKKTCGKTHSDTLLCRIHYYLWHWRRTTRFEKRNHEQKLRYFSLLPLFATFRSISWSKVILLLSVSVRFFFKFVLRRRKI